VIVENLYRGGIVVDLQVIHAFVTLLLWLVKNVGSIPSQVWPRWQNVKRWHAVYELLAPSTQELSPECKEDLRFAVPR
jgi:hypothetical protein